MEILRAMDTKRTAQVGILRSDRDVRIGVRALTRACPVMARVHSVTGVPKLRRTPSGFPGLLKIVVGQQLSIASATAIWGRVSSALKPLEPQSLLEHDDQMLAACGLSRPKIRTARALSMALVEGSLNLETLEDAPEAAVREALTAVVGIGPWTADIYLMFCLGRRDSWAPGDLALQVATQRAFRFRDRPDRGRMEEVAERWRPWRAVAAHLLWSYYATTDANRRLKPLSEIKREKIG